MIRWGTGTAAGGVIVGGCSCATVVGAVELCLRLDKGGSGLSANETSSSKLCFDVCFVRFDGLFVLAAPKKTKSVKKKGQRAIPRVTYTHPIWTLGSPSKTVDCQTNTRFA
jgi:hypothetical protein